MELFVQDMDVSVDFYCRVLGFELTRRDAGYASVRSGSVVLGLGPISKLPEEEGSFNLTRLAGDRGAGVEIVLEVDDIEEFHEQLQVGGYPVLDGLEQRPWGHTNFRMADPDGYYLRPTSRA
jgi:lactoylglutathione lyase